jgi:hypothetical protein
VEETIVPNHMAQAESKWFLSNNVTKSRCTSAGCNRTERNAPGKTKQKTGEPTQSVRIIAYMSRRRRWRFSRCCWWLNFPPHHPPSSESVPTFNGRRPLNGGGKRRSPYTVAYPFWTPMETFFFFFLKFRTLSMAEWPIVNTSYPT